MIKKFDLSSALHVAQMFNDPVSLSKDLSEYQQMGEEEKRSERVSTYRLTCPFCVKKGGKAKKDLSVSLYADGSFGWNCFKCGSASRGIVQYYVYRKEARFIDKDNNLSKDEWVSYKRMLEKDMGCNEIHIENTPIRRIEKFEIAPLYECDRTYNKMFEKLTLAQPHRADLLRRGLRDEDIEGEYKSYPQSSAEIVEILSNIKSEFCVTSGVPGFFKKNGTTALVPQGSGYLIPVREVPDDFDEMPKGKIQGFQIRLDETKEDFPRYMWISSSNRDGGTSAVSYPHFVGYPAREVILTEGALKANITNRFTNRPVLSVQGVGCQGQLSPALEKLRRFGVQKIVTAFDMDYKTNPNVQKQYDRLIALLKQMGFQYDRWEWDEKDKGIDDHLLSQYLANGGKI